MATTPGPPYPPGNRDERELLLSWLAFLRANVIRKVEGLSELLDGFTGE